MKANDIEWILNNRYLREPLIYGLLFAAAGVFVGAAKVIVREERSKWELEQS